MFQNPSDQRKPAREDRVSAKQLEHESTDAKRKEAMSAYD
jgi:hypothetical protein